MQKEEKRKLIRAALEARQRAYMPYSGYAVGAAVLMESGKTYTCLLYTSPSPRDS